MSRFGKIIAEVRESVFLVMANTLPRVSLFNRFRYRFLHLAGVSIKGHCTIWSGFDIRPIGHASHLTIAENVFINRHFRCAMPGDARVSIGAGSAIGPNVMIETASHGVTIATRKQTFSQSVSIGKNVWIGAGAIILGGVVIGENSVVAAGAVVTGNVAPNTVVGGVPAKVIKVIECE